MPTNYLHRSLFLATTAAFIGLAPATIALAQPDAPEITVRPARSRVKVIVHKAPAKSRTTRVVLRHNSKPGASPGMKAVVLDEPNLQEGTVQVVTEGNEFATIAVNPGTRFLRGYQLAALSNLHPGYEVRATGRWDQDGYQYQAQTIRIGGTLDDVQLTQRVADACARVSASRKSGGFGYSSVAMIPTAGLPKAVSVGGTAPATQQPAPPTASPAPPTAPTTPTTTPPAAPGTTPAPGTPATSPGSTYPVPTTREPRPPTPANPAPGTVPNVPPPFFPTAP